MPREPADGQAVVGVVPHMQCMGVIVVQPESHEVIVDELGMGMGRGAVTGTGVGAGIAVGNVVRAVDESDVKMYVKCV